MRVDRLKKLAEYLKTIDPALFDLEKWAVDRDCGTVCCAFGHAPSIFPELKLYSEIRFYGRMYWVWWADRDFDDLEDDVIDCIQEFFDIDRKTANQIFFPSEYPSHFPPTIDNVIARIYNKIAGYSGFAELYRAGEETGGRINTYIDRWSDSGREIPLYDYLGMTKDELIRFIEGDSLREILYEEEEK